MRARLTHELAYESGDEPGIMIDIPAVEDFGTMVQMLQRTGAEIADSTRTFAIKGPLNLEQASALVELALWGGDAAPLRIRVVGVEVPEDDPGAAEDWWQEQQHLRSERRLRR